ncbi:hypothetical protein [Corynebacterium cystitidis]|uniref:hypothetical protein n=1 Tax=Corynebacterium cystitidis TaxID=35757 RepID=UPI00211E71F4|nr:hypothetical protein [Corynebacterium cystitidis]
MAPDTANLPAGASNVLASAPLGPGGVGFFGALGVSSKERQTMSILMLRITVHGRESCAGWWFVALNDERPLPHRDL